MKILVINEDSLMLMEHWKCEVTVKRVKTCTNSFLFTLLLLITGILWKLWKIIYCNHTFEFVLDIATYNLGKMVHLHVLACCAVFNLKLPLPHLTS